MIAATAMFGVAAIGVATQEESLGAAVEAKIGLALPYSWTVVDRKSGTLPRGHYWGQEYDGIHGDEIVIEGGENVHVAWRDTRGDWHKEAVGKEALKLYVMPAAYRESLLRFFIPKRPVAASLLFESQSIKVYAYPSVRIVDTERVDWIVKHGTAIRWPDSPETTRILSWSNWADDIPKLLKGM